MINFKNSGKIVLCYFVHHNVDNKAATLEEIPARLLAQLYSPVNWTGAVESLRSAADVAVEFGPGKVLAGLNKRIDKTLTTVSTGDSRGVAAAIELIQGS